ncbi:hypothetical protein COW53_05225 [bacterium CG17_big_fil_post_rev_8_21_14_2_50_64_8]|nr:MAG: hypothetical protein COW53_05225 [bacterium CG17_big_fil_post_rev_8_21_14_2_50_64_8]PJA76191.1 MAG: hypothetical protein CO151_03575 [bacterium CG_4_9_14_3_um_filter_65_15]
MWGGPAGSSGQGPGPAAGYSSRPQESPGRWGHWRERSPASRPPRSGPGIATRDQTRGRRLR